MFIAQFIIMTGQFIRQKKLHYYYWSLHLIAWFPRMKKKIIIKIELRTFYQWKEWKKKKRPQYTDVCAHFANKNDVYERKTICCLFCSLLNHFQLHEFYKRIRLTRQSSICWCIFYVYFVVALVCHLIHSSAIRPIDLVCTKCKRFTIANIVKPQVVENKRWIKIKARATCVQYTQTNIDHLNRTANCAFHSWDRILSARSTSHRSHTSGQKIYIYSTHSIFLHGEVKKKLCTYEKQRY